MAIWVSPQLRNFLPWLAGLGNIMPRTTALRYKNLAGPAQSGLQQNQLVEIEILKSEDLARPLASGGACILGICR